MIMEEIRLKVEFKGSCPFELTAMLLDKLINNCLRIMNSNANIINIDCYILVYAILGSNPDIWVTA